MRRLEIQRLREIRFPVRRETSQPGCARSADDDTMEKLNWCGRNNRQARSLLHSGHELAFLEQVRLFDEPPAAHARKIVLPAARVADRTIAAFVKSEQR